MKQLYTVTFCKTIVLSLVLFFGLAGNKAMGQAVNSVNITVSITPPYSPYYSDYAGANAGKVLLIVQNLSNTQKTIKLAGQLTGDNGVKLSTRSNYVPLQPIILAPNEVKKLSGITLKDIFDLNTLNVYGVDKAKLLQTSRLPEGNYNFCVQALDYANNQMLSANAPLGCTNINIAYPDAPVLINPLNNVLMQVTTPQSLVFNWINAGLVPLGTQYVLQIAEMPARVLVDPNQLLNSSSFPLLNKTISSMSYVLSPSDPPLKAGTRYAWRIKAEDPSGKITFKNNGVSAASIFMYSAPEIVATQATTDIPILVPDKANMGKAIEVNNKYALYLRWKLINSNEDVKSTGFSTFSRSSAVSLQSPTKTWPVITPYAPLKYVVEITDKETNKVIDSKQAIDAFYYSEQTAVPSKFVNGKTYEFMVKAYKAKDLSGFTSEKTGMKMQVKPSMSQYSVLTGESKVGSFIYKVIPDTISTLKYMSLAGTVKYQFEKKSGLYPVSGNIQLTKYYRQLAADGKTVLKDNIPANSVNATESSKFVTTLGNLGAFQVKVPIVANPSGMQGFYRVEIPENNYYRWPAKTIEATNKEGYQNVGEFVSKVYHYKLNLHLTKGYAQKTYNKAGEVKVRVSEGLAGLKVLIYRSVKGPEVPHYEGQDTSLNAKLYDKTLPYSATLVGTATTRVSAVNPTEALASIDLLLCSSNDQDLYWIKVYDPKTNATVINQQFAFRKQTKTFAPPPVKYHDSYETAGEYSYEVEKKLTWTTEQAPLASIKGRLLYRYNDGIGGAQPLRNASISLRPFIILSPKGSGKTYALPVSQMEKLTYVDENNEPKINLSADDKKLIGYMNGFDPKSAALTTTKADGTFEFKDVALWDSVFVSKDWYNFNIPFESIVPDKKQNPAGQFARDLYLAQLMGDDAAAAEAFKAFKAMVIKSATDPLRDDFSQLDGMLQGIDPTKDASKGDGQLNTDYEGGYTLTGTKAGQVAAGLKGGVKLNLKQNLNGGPSDGQPDGGEIMIKDVPAGLSAPAACKARMVYRIVVVDEDVYCSPDNDIEVNPLQTLDAGILYSTVRTVKLKSKVYKGDEYKNGTGPQVLKIPVHLVRKAIIPNLAGEGDKLNSPADQDKMIVDKAVTTYPGITFNHVLKNKEYTLKAVIHEDADNSTSYKASAMPFNFKSPEADLTTQIGKTFLFNSDFKEEEFQVDMVLPEDDPIIAGRVLNSVGTQGISDASVIITTTFKQGIKDYTSTMTVNVDKDGYFNYKSPDFIDREATVEVSVGGYSPAFNSDSTKMGYYSFNISKMNRGQKVFKNLYFTPSSYLRGYVVNEQKQPVPSLYKIKAIDYIMETKNECGTLGSLSCKETFKAYAQTGIPARLVIIPNDLKYFNDTLIINNVGLAIKNAVLERVLYTREHRINFIVRDAKGKPVGGAKIEILNKILYTGADGMVKYNFMNISEENFTIKISGPEGLDYITMETSFKNAESKVYRDKLITLREGLFLRGYVRLEDGTPLNRAEVYINSGDGASILRTRTREDGYYELKGISPKRGYGKALVLTVTASGPNYPSGTILAKTETIDYNQTSQLDFELSLLREVSVKRLLGYPVIIEEAIPTNDGFVISGSVDLSRSRGDFVLSDPNMRAGFSEVLVRRVQGEDRGLAVLDATDNVRLDLTAFKARFKDAYNASVEGNGSLVIRNMGDGTGALQVRARIIDNSFDFPRSYMAFNGSQFHFAAGKLQKLINPNGTSFNTVVMANSFLAFSSFTPNESPTYYFTDEKKEAIQFSLLDFPASTDPAETYFVDGKIRLLPLLKPSGINTLTGPISVKLPEVFIDKTTVSKINSDLPLEFDLDTKWKVIVPAWEFSTEEGGIVAKVSSKNVIKTGVLDIPFSSFRLRNDILLIDKSDLGKIMLGGFAPLTVSPQTESTFGIDDNIGSDKGKHYILRLLGKDNKSAGKISGLAGFTEGIDIAAVTLVSNGEQYVDFAPNSKSITAFKQVNFEPLMIESSKGDFTLMGNVDLGIPRMQSFYGGFKYSSLNSATPEFKAIKFDIGKGYVVFESPVSNSKTIVNDRIEMAGTVYEPNNQLDPITVKLVKTPDSTSITQVGANSFAYGGGTTMNVSNAATRVTNQDWDYLTFTGKMRKAGGERLDGFKDDNPIPFKVYGEVTCDNGQIGVSDINTPFGDMRLVFNWPKKELLGNLKISQLDLGGVSMTGEAEIAMGASGFYLFAAGDVDFGIPPFSPLRAGVLIGKYSNISMDVLTRTMQFNRNKTLPVCQGQKYDLFGMLVSGRKDLFKPIDFQLDLPPLLPLLSVGLAAEVGVDASMFMNFSQKPSITLAVGAFGSVSITAASITGTSASGSVNVDVTGRLGYVYGDGFNANFFSGLSLGYSVVQKIPFMDDIRKSGNMSLSAQADFNSSRNPKVTFELSTATAAEVKCGEATNK
jgi:hypothetical protein